MLNLTPTYKYYWTFTCYDTGELYDAEFETMSQAHDRANELYVIDVLNGGDRRCIAYSEPIELVRCYYDDIDGLTEVERIPARVWFDNSERELI